MIPHQQINATLFMLVTGVWFGALGAASFPWAAGAGLDFGTLYVDGFNEFDFMKTELWDSMADFAITYVMFYVLVIGSNIWPHSGTHKRKVRFRWRRDVAVFLLVFALFLIQTLLASAVYFVIDENIGIVLGASYFFFITFLLTKKWVRLWLFKSVVRMRVLR